MLFANEGSMHFWTSFYIKCTFCDLLWHERAFFIASQIYSAEPVVSSQPVCCGNPATAKVLLWLSHVGGNERNLRTKLVFKVVTQRRTDSSGLTLIWKFLRNLIQRIPRACAQIYSCHNLAVICWKLLTVATFMSKTQSHSILDLNETTIDWALSLLFSWSYQKSHWLFRTCR